jgi:tetratricopeptide (TPR) repeat protein
METVRTWNKINKKVPVPIILISFALLMIILGFYYRFQPQRLIRNDIREYNEGVVQFNEGVKQFQLAAETLAEDQVAYDTFFADGVRNVDQIIKETFDSALVHFDKAIIESKNNELKSLTYYNLGTMIGIISGDIRFREDVRYEIVVAFDKLREAIKHNPYNEDAKYNLELLERIYNLEETEGIEEITIQGYTPGILRKGF